MSELTQERLKELLHYDPETGVFTRLTGRPRDMGKRPGTLSKALGYRLVGVDGKQYLEHRLVWLYAHGYMPKYIDHINHDRADNRLANLRDVPQWQNIHNSKTRTDNTSGHRGVHFYKPYQRWQVYINVQGTRYTLGYTDSYEEAVKVYEQASTDLGAGVPPEFLRASSRTSPLHRRIQDGRESGRNC